MKTLKDKFNIFYFCIILSLILIISVTSAINLYSIRNEIDKFMINNYDSIKACTNMLSFLEEQNADLLAYINTNDVKKSESLYTNNSYFYKWFNVERNNITEPNEKNLVEQVNNDYVKYMSQLPKFLQIKSANGTEASNVYYENSIKPIYNRVIKDLKNISNLNETAMINNKNKLRDTTDKFLYLILFLSIIAVVIGFLASNYFINKFLRPLYSLNETIKSIKEGNLDIEAPVISEDEVGEVTQEFNKMTKRLKEYENSNAGQLMNEKNKSLAIVKSISDPLVVLDTDFRFKLLNHAFENFFNITENEAINKHFLEIINNSELYKHIFSVINAKEEKDPSKIIQFKSDKQEFYFNVICTLVKNTYANTTGIVILFQNVTELKLLEKMKANFISTVSHEFKTPLTSIMIGTSLVLDKNIGILNEKQKNIITTIRDDGERLSELVTNLLQLSKIESNNEIYEFKACSIIGIIDTCVKNFYERASVNEVNLYYDADESLPRIKADSEKIVWVINNLISNALKYTNAGDEIFISAEVKHNEMYVSVKDTGIGIPEEYIEKIFNKFVQVIGSDSEARGTGLGLTISKEIVEAHNGTINCESEVDGGSTFIFTLPLAE